MDAGSVVFIFIIILLGILIIILIISLATSTNNIDSCTVNTDCPAGYICSNSLCYAEVNTPCYSTEDCLTGLNCHNGVCVAVQQTPVQQTSVQQTPVVMQKAALATVPKSVTWANNKIQTQAVLTATPSVVNQPVINQPVNTIVQPPVQNIQPPVQNIQPLRAYVPTDSDFTPLSEPSYRKQTPIIMSDLPPVKTQKIKPKPKPIVYTDSTGSNDTNGLETDAYVDVKSCSTTPCLKPICHKNSCDNILDAVNFSNYIIYLTVSNTTSISDRIITNNIKLRKLVSFAGYLYGLSGGLLYTLTNEQLVKNNWNWTKVNWAASNINTISASLDSSVLWIHDGRYGYIYTNPGTIRSKIEYPKHMKRVYGKDGVSYIDIDQNIFRANIHPTGASMNDIYDGVMNYDGSVVAITPTQKDTYRGIVLVNWRPYYLTR